MGQVYVRKVFSPALKASTLDMVRRIEDAMGQRIRQLDWMSPETKAQALTKLHDSQQDRLSRQVARLQRGQDCAR